MRGALLEQLLLCKGMYRIANVVIACLTAVLSHTTVHVHGYLTLVDECACSLAIEEARLAGDEKCLAEACRALSLVVSGDAGNQELVVTHPKLVTSLHQILEEAKGGEAEGQAGKVLNSLCHLLPVPVDAKRPRKS